ncbi:hypothetical protein AAFF_G00278800 [Aldrovandia affinis]|uniref:Uncharacterized protein n=1 Tax=Aldrovandia affinis TaxID=143900 RepID=A0AAD7WS15_9TELE|nr:hypothetical protein AAFF_G00278800 [Aldrovandia affinis]
MGRHPREQSNATSPLEPTLCKHDRAFPLCSGAHPWVLEKRTSPTLHSWLAEHPPPATTTSVRNTSTERQRCLPRALLQTPKLLDDAGGQWTAGPLGHPPLLCDGSVRPHEEETGPAHRGGGIRLQHISSPSPEKCTNSRWLMGRAVNPTNPILLRRRIREILAESLTSWGVREASRSHLARLSGLPRQGPRPCPPLCST